MNIGVFGGTFDPPHTGHLIVAQDAALALALDRVLFIPAATPPHKRDATITAPRLRAGMLELAIRGDERFVISMVELDRTGPSFTVDTLDVLHEQYPGSRFTLLIGADQYAEFETWREPARIRRLARVAVLTRQGGDGLASADIPTPALPAAAELPGGDSRVTVTRIDISATAIRNRVAAGHSIRYLVPDAVEQFIHANRLYSRNGLSVTG